ncbi:MAG: CpsD/CapB family tyrosine-protein kinase [Acidobacteriaceae bacterium]|nr:CpsD/CapB family tyrosine-protein kinase [Acidobacteriaceae bacterium]MBV9225907.1 CpsD/CapB family tyrosine-protein kinase [Acidobacteriaceae bacterium]MBV9306057.1 CpsD/CapB family tyrosine-protein kinase [Acidobacteriaceae bacterium]
MSRVHDALRKASQESYEPRRPGRAERTAGRAEVHRSEAPLPPPIDVPAPPAAAETEAFVRPDTENLEDLIANAREIPFNPLPDALIIHPTQPRQAPAEEFKTLRTRLDHLQRLQPLHTLVVTSASPAEGKSFTAINLAITQSQLAQRRVLLADFDFRRPSIHSTLQVHCCPGITDYLVGKAALSDILLRVAGTNLYVLPAGESVPNPLELLNLRECKSLIEELRNHFDWVILDSPPLLFAADGNLLATMCDGTILVVRIGSTTYDSVARAMQSLCENNVLGVVVNGARRGELYSKYTYYHDYYYTRDGKPVVREGEDAENTEEPVESAH